MFVPIIMTTHVKEVVFVFNKVGEPRNQGSETALRFLYMIASNPLDKSFL